jgi:DNA-binding transcriptional MerR regulator
VGVILLEKPSSAFRTISEVASELDVPKHVLRFWEGKFSQLRPMKRGGGRRYYRPEDVDLLKGIRWLLYSDGYTIKGVQRILRDNGVRFVKECWQDTVADDSNSASTHREIPNLAGEAANEARRTPRFVRRTDLSSRIGDIGLIMPKDDFTPDQQAFLAVILKELEQCRDLLTAAKTDRDRSG